jgi:hypothetical protein
LKKCVFTSTTHSPSIFPFWESYFIFFLSSLCIQEVRAIETVKIINISISHWWVEVRTVLECFEMGLSWSFVKNIEEFLI